MANGWEPSIREFERQDARQRPPKGGIVLAGSSTFTLWQDAARAFPFADIVNRGFGGSMMADLVEYADRIVVPYAPRLVVVYSGDNDLACGKSPETVRDDCAEFARRVRAALPAADLAIVSVKPSPSRWALAAQQQTANRLLQQFAATHPRVWFIDVFDAMLGTDGRPRPELYIDDQLHLSAAGYALWRELLEPFLRPYGRAGCC